MRLVGVGDNVVDRYRDLGTMFPGGQALNVAVFAQRFGLSAAYLGVLGDDVAGRHVLGAMRAEGIETSRVRVVHGPNATADVALIDGNREFLGSDPGVSKFRLTPEDLAYLSTFDLIHSSESSYLEDQLDRLAGAAQLSFDFSVRREESYLAPILPHVAIAEFSLSDLDDADTRDWLEAIHARGPRIVLATRGSGDAMVFDGHRHRRQPSVPSEPIDTLGAGDAFIARFLVGHLRSEPVADALEAASVAAAETCAAFGAFGHGTAAYPPMSSDGDVTVASALAR